MSAFGSDRFQTILDSLSSAQTELLAEYVNPLTGNQAINTIEALIAWKKADPAALREAGCDPEDSTEIRLQGKPFTSVGVLCAGTRDYFE